MVYSYLPFMVLPLYASLEKLDRSLLEAAADLGAAAARRSGSITFPLSMPGVVAGCCWFSSRPWANSSSPTCSGERRR